MNIATKGGRLYAYLEFVYGADNIGRGLKKMTDEEIKDVFGASRNHLMRLAEQKVRSISILKPSLRY